MHYILKASNNAFIIAQENGDMIITSDYEKATQYPTIGEAMKSASKVNKDLGTKHVKVISIG